MEELAHHFGSIITGLGEDLDREGLVDTPIRAAEAMRFLTRGYRQEPKDVINGAIFETDADEMVVVRDIELYSLCEHHLLPFFGRCHVGYVPHGKVIGLSKIARLVDLYARRLQLQERLTTELATCIQEQTEAYGVGVIVEARHLCMMMRGVEKQNSSMTTSCMLGSFKHNGTVRAEFLDLVRQ
ncbi:MAG: GTP cyclohydrolase I FolE [Deltaproteobacteria bacterium RIFOXYA12_FULL_61_11]|nr:MAG: GTP cyclohydrolase I FolE [Deltaproteobacteria bacterium RIFOXYA12_FULL_61_11]